MISWETDLLCLFFTQVLVKFMINVYKNDLPQEWLLSTYSVCTNHNVFVFTLKVLHTMHFRFTKLKLASVFLLSCLKKNCQIKSLFSFLSKLLHLSALRSDTKLKNEVWRWKLRLNELDLKLSQNLATFSPKNTADSLLYFCFLLYLHLDTMSWNSFWSSFCIIFSILRDIS